MKNYVSSLLCIGLLGLLLPTAAPAFKRVAVGEALHPFRLDTPAGTPLSIPEARGEKATLVVFWAVWNPRSAQLLEDLQTLYNEQGQSGLQIVAVNAEHAEWNPATLQGVNATIQERGLTYPVVLDRDLAVYNDYGAVAMPSTLLADAEGRIVALQEGYPTAARLDLREQVLVALGLREPTPADSLAQADGPHTDPKVRRQVEMGRLLLERRRPARAVTVLEQAIREDPTYPEGYRVLAQVLDALGRGAEAAAARDQVAALTSHAEHSGTALAPADTPQTPSSPAAR